MRQPLYNSDPLYGPTCTCGEAKAKQARTCQSCHGRLRGYRDTSKVSVSDYNRAYRLRWLGMAETVGDETAALVARADALAAACASVTGELATLVIEQERDDHSGHLARTRWMLSLDDVDLFGRPLYEVIAA